MEPLPGVPIEGVSRSRKKYLLPTGLLRIVTHDVIGGYHGGGNNAPLMVVYLLYEYFLPTDTNNLPV